MSKRETDDGEERLTIIRSIIENIEIFFENMENDDPANIIIHLPNIQTHLTLLEEENIELERKIDREFDHIPHMKNFYQEQRNDFQRALTNFQQRYQAKKYKAMAPSLANPNGLNGDKMESNIRLARKNLLQAQENTQLANDITAIMQDYNKKLKENMIKTQKTIDLNKRIQKEGNQSKRLLAKIRINRFLNGIGGWLLFGLLLVIDVIVLIIRFKKKK
ncbi:hypothetical protein TRFO_32477 [Tritrichomonas foetus]|uniref:Uncharacterized protein n=1 Tax=Tritrichomonas foetus TaxID=1144522 RepID=A0A1J4JNP5_9EUKA|nr:hypothetical protein TRFO_32477 [Tritrichomonas foetus]|eukprot:OHT00745.1 hypothetical protein TRFO_32477 [Tritrichomonas foetus]